MMMANPEVYVVSPNRNVPTRTWNPLEVVRNFISKVPPNLSPLYSTQKDTNYVRILKNKIRDSFVLGR